MKEFLKFLGFGTGSKISQLAKALTIGAGVLAGSDKNNTGIDDDAAAVLAAGGDALAAYDAGQWNDCGKYLDAVIEGATRLKQEFVRTGKIIAVNSVK